MGFIPGTPHRSQEPTEGLVGLCGTLDVERFRSQRLAVFTATSPGVRSCSREIEAVARCRAEAGCGAMSARVGSTRGGQFRRRKSGRTHDLSK